MKRHLKILIVVLLCCWINHSKAQNILDSLRGALNKENIDSQKVKILNDISWEYSYSNLDSAMYFTNLAYDISKKIDYLNGIADCHNMYGIIYRSQSKFDKAIAEFNALIEIRKKQNLTVKLIPPYTNLANVYLNTNDNVNAIAYYKKALAIAEEYKRNDYIITLINNLSIVYKDMGLYDMALSLLNRALELNKKINNKIEEASSLSNMGVIFQEKNMWDLAIKNNLLALKIYTDYDYKEPMGHIYNNLGICYRHINDLPNAIIYTNKSIVIFKELGSDYNLALGIHNLGIIYQYLKNYSKAQKLQDESIALCIKIEEEPCLAKSYMSKSEMFLEENVADSALFFAKKGISIILRTDLKDEIADCYRTLSEIYFLKNDFKNAYLSQKLQLQYKDSVTTKEFSSNLASVQTLYEVDKKENEIKLLTADGIIQNEKINQQRILTIAIVLILILVAAFGVFFYKAFVNKKKDNQLLQSQKLEIEEKNEELNQQNEEISAQRDQIEIQKHKVEEHQKEIIDSITYAQRLQQAILPSEEFISRNLTDHFLLYKPKDIVAGDFYWAETIGDLFLIAAADSTGHGVPGAMVSVVCSNALNRSVKEFGLADPGKILDKTRELVLETFAKSNSEVNDGMDVSLISIEYRDRSKEKPIVKWSGANNPLWYISPVIAGEARAKQFANDEQTISLPLNEDFILTEIKADKQPIGKSDHKKPFTTHTIDLKEGAVIYLLTDGYPDQFGGPKGKKYKYKQLEELIVSIADKTLSEQSRILDQKFEEWKGPLEQVDDVTIIGIKI